MLGHLQEGSVSSALLLVPVRFRSPGFVHARHAREVLLLPLGMPLWGLSLSAFFASPRDCQVAELSRYGGRPALQLPRGHRPTVIVEEETAVIVVLER